METQHTTSRRKVEKIHKKVITILTRKGTNRKEMGFFQSLVAALSLIFVISLCCIICCAVYLHRKKVPDDWAWFDRSYIMEEVNPEQAAALAAHDLEEEKKAAAQSRHDLVISLVTVKTVIAGSNRYNDNNSKSNLQSSVVRDAMSNSVKTVRGWVGNESPSKSSKGKSSQENTELFDDGNDGNKSKQKGDICLEKTKYRLSISQLTTSLRNSLGSSAASMELYTTKSCFICLERYKVGESIVWSKNKECCHSFHENCMVRWLIDHDDCPLCRKDYLKIV